MNSKKISLYILLSIGGFFGGFIAKLCGAVPFGLISVILTAIGSLGGIYVWYKMGE